MPRGGIPAEQAEAIPRHVSAHGEEVQKSPTINYTDPDPECDHVGEGARPVAIDLAVSLTFAIGSQTSAVVLGAAA